MARAFVYNSVLIMPYDHIKEAMFTNFGEGYINRIIALIVASAAGTLAVLPIDNMKTRI